MASLTYYVALPFVSDDDTGEPVVEAGQEAPSEHSAISRARSLIGRKAGVIAFRRTGDPSLGDFDDAVTGAVADNQGAHEKMSDYFFTNAPGRTHLIADIAKWFYQVVASEVEMNPDAAARQH